MKILVFRDKKTNNITCVYQCSAYNNLESIVQEFNEKDSNVVEVKNLKPQSLEEFLFNNYMSKKSTKEDLEECLMNLHTGTKRLQIVFDNIKNELEAINEQKRINK